MRKPALELVVANRVVLHPQTMAVARLIKKLMRQNKVRAGAYSTRDGRV
jgi:hypothetical protein